MELRQLRHFIAVGEAGSITAAAKKLRLTQPALSRQIKALEEELGTALLERGAHSISLTPAGETLLVEAGKLIQSSDSLIRRVRATALGEPLRVGYAPSLARAFLSVAICRFTQFHPRAEVRLLDLSSAEMRQGLVDGRLDLIVAAPCEGLAEPIRWVALHEYGWQVVMPTRHPLAEKPVVAPEDLDGQRLLLYDREHYPDYWDRVTGYFRERKMQAKVAGEFDGVSSLMAALEGNLGIALMAAGSPLGSRVTARPLADGPPSIRVAAGVLAQTEPTAQVLAFLEELKRAAGEL